MHRPSKARPNLFVTHYCVVRIADLSTLYTGRDGAKAMACHDENSVLETGYSLGDAERHAALEAGKRKTALAQQTINRRS